MKFGTLHIILPDGKSRDYLLDQPALSVGRADGNELIIDHTSVSRRHARLSVEAGILFIEDLLSANGTFIGSQRLDANTKSLVLEDQEVLLGEVRIRYAPPVVIEVTRPKEPEAEPQGPPVSISLVGPAQPVAAGMTTTASLTIQNRGTVVDELTIKVSGLPPEWMRFTKSRVPLLPTKQETITITFAPPRRPDATAGEHPFIISVISKEHRTGANAPGTLTVLPFPGFSFSLNPQRSTQKFQVLVQNQGNAPTAYHFSGGDDEQGLAYQFQQDDVSLEPGQSAAMSLEVTPKIRPKIGIRETRSFNITAAPIAGAEPAVKAAGQLIVHPPIPIWLIPLVLALTVLVCGALAQLYSQICGPLGAVLLCPANLVPIIAKFDVTPLEVEEGGQVRVTWEVSGADTIELMHPESETMQGEEKKQGQKLITVTKTTEFTLSAKNFAGPVTRGPILVTVKDSRPVIQSFKAEPGEIEQGGTITLTWIVSNAVTLELLDPPMNLPISDTMLAIPNVQQSKNFTLRATSKSGLQEVNTAQVTIKNSRPVIQSFKADPEIVTGVLDPVTISWDVIGAENVVVEPALVLNLENTGKVQLKGYELYSEDPPFITFILTATNLSGSVTRTLIIARNWYPCVTDRQTSLRAGPSEKHKVLAQLSADMRVLHIGRNSTAEWLQVYADRLELEGWVAAADILCQDLILLLPTVVANNYPPEPSDTPVPVRPTSTPTPVPPTVTPAPPPPNITDWRGEYFNNPNVQGTPVLVRNDPAINFNWGRNPPDPGVPANNFSVRWTRTLAFEGRMYRFSARADDGVKVYVDDKPVIDEWHAAAPTEYTGDVNLTAGPHTVRVEYSEGVFDAYILVKYEPITSFANWKGEYFNTPALDGSPLLTRDDAAIAFDWGANPPATGLPAQRWSARWTRTANFTGGVYRFTLRAGGGVRLLIDDTSIINEWHTTTGEVYVRDANLAQGTHKLAVEYYQEAGGAFVWLTYQPPPTEITKWRSEFYANDHWQGLPTLIRNDDQLDFDWGTGAPDPLLPADHFSARFTRSLDLPAGEYQFDILVDDGVRFYVDGLLALDQVREQAATQSSPRLTLSQGKHDFRLDYVDYTGQARLAWSLTPTPGSPGQSATITPTLPSNLPVINLFTVAPNPVVAGACVSLDWQAGGGAIIARLLRDGAVFQDNVPLTGSTSDCPSSPGTVIYRLEALNAQNQSAAHDVSVTVQAPPTTATPGAPAINSFTVDKTSVVGGQCVALSWVTSNVTTQVDLQINGQAISSNLPASGSAQHCPVEAGTKQYQIIITAPPGGSPITSTVTVQVTPP